VVIARKGVVLALLIFSTLLVPSPMVKASKTTNDFYLKAYITSQVIIDWYHFAGTNLGDKLFPKYVLFHVTEEGILENVDNVEVGTITVDIVAEILDIEALTGTVTGKYEINFYSGEIIMGTITGKLLKALASDMEWDGKFVGHGDMNVIGELYIIEEDNFPVLVLDGYSW